jgi:hypothetical protein
MMAVENFFSPPESRNPAFATAPKIGILVGKNPA